MALYSLNCAALNENLLDTELFGHEAGRLPGTKRHPGRFERADGGTLFLDELATAPMLVQEKLLRVIEIRRAGARRRQPAAAGQRASGVRHQCQPAGNGGGGQIRADLLDRLAFDVVQLPPLRERKRHHAAGRTVCYSDVP
jgi:psp operon transcriptional activator